MPKADGGIRRKTEVFAPRTCCNGHESLSSGDIMQATSVFLAEPSNAKLLTGEKKRIGNSFVMFLIALIFIVAAVVAGYFLYTRYSQHQALLTEGKQTRGIVTDGFEETSRNFYVIESKRYRIEYRYTIAGQTYTGGQDIDGALYEELFLQSPVTIVFLPSNPGVSELGGEFADDTEYRNALLILGSLTLVALLAAAGFLFRDVRNRRLSSQGQILNGTLLSAAGQYYRRTLNVTFRYEFRSPLGTTITGSRTVKRNDLKKAPVPVSGTPIKVLYVNDKLHRIL